MVLGKIIGSMQLGFVLVLLLGISSLTVSQTLVESLPGYPGILPFKLETGYIGVGENEVVQLFYYFVESEGNPEEDPLIIWLDGGPMQFEHGEYVGDVPLLKLDPNSWTKVANVIYLDAPTMTGYSYTKVPNIVSSDTLSSSQTTEFLRKFVRNHPKFLSNPMYVTGISYSGMVIPMITEEIYKGNDLGLEPVLNIKGYMEANPLTNQRVDINSRLEYAYHMALISYELYESTRKNCNGEYADAYADANNLSCMRSIEEVNKRIVNIDMQQILDPDCQTEESDLVKAVNPIRPAKRKSLGHEPIRILGARTPLKDVFCRGDYYTYAGIWANNKKVMKALNVRKGTIKVWSLCNANMTYRYNESSMPAYDFDVRNSVAYHVNLTKRNCRALIFSGDHDLVVPHIGTRNWIHSLNVTITDSNWDAWYVEGQVAGYKTTYVRDNYSLVFTTVKGAGHTAPEFKPKECFAMVQRWFAYQPI